MANWWLHCFEAELLNARGRTIITPSARSAPAYLGLIKQPQTNFGQAQGGRTNVWDGALQKTEPPSPETRTEPIAAPERKKRLLGRFDESQEEGDRRRVRRRGRRLLLKCLNETKSAASQGPPVGGNRKWASKKRWLCGIHVRLNVLSMSVRWAGRYFSARSSGLWKARFKEHIKVLYWKP